MSHSGNNITSNPFGSSNDGPVTSDQIERSREASSDGLKTSGQNKRPREVSNDGPNDSVENSSDLNQVVTIAFGSDRAEFKVHRKLITSVSWIIDHYMSEPNPRLLGLGDYVPGEDFIPFNEKAIRSRENYLFLPISDGHMASIFIAWCYERGPLSEYRGFITPEFYDSFPFRAWFFGKKLASEPFCKASLELIDEDFGRGLPTPEAVAYVYKITIKNSIVRKIVVNEFITSCNTCSFEEPKWEGVQHAFYSDCRVAHAVARAQQKLLPCGRCALCVKPCRRMEN